MSKYFSIEEKIIDWEEKCYINDGCTHFHTCVFKKNFGKFKIGNKCDTFIIDLNNSIIQIYVDENDKTPTEYRIKLEIE